MFVTALLSLVLSAPSDRNCPELPYATSDTMSHSMTADGQPFYI